MSRISSSAVINAPVLTVRAPFDAEIIKPSDTSAAPIAAQDTILTLAAVRPQQDDVPLIRAQLETDTARRAAITTQLESLETLRLQLEDRLKLQIENSKKWIASRSKEAESELSETLLQQDLLTEDLERDRLLMRSGTISKKQLSNRETQYEMLHLEVARHKAKLEGLRVAALAVEDGISVDSEFGSGTYILQRLDEIALLRADLETEFRVLTTHITALNKRLAVAQGQADQRQSFKPTAAIAGVIWKASPGAGVIVNDGATVAQLLDCGRRFVEVLIDERHFEEIRPGDSVTIKLKGSATSTSGVVEAIRGSGATVLRSELAAEPRIIGTNQFSVLVRLPAVEIVDANVAATFCDVGRTAEVKFDRKHGLDDFVRTSSKVLADRIAEFVAVPTITLE